MVEREYRKGLQNYDLAREELGQVSTTMHDFHLIEFSLYPQKKWLEENNYKYHYVYVSMLVKIIVVKKCIDINKSISVVNNRMSR